MWLQLIMQILGSAAAQQASKMGKDESMKLIKSVSDAYGNIDLPQLKELFSEKQKDTALAGIRDNPEYLAQQKAADTQLNDIISSGGLTLADRAALNQIRRGSARNESAGRSAIEQGMAARGSLDSGAQLATQLQGNQQAANASAQADESAAAQAQARTFQAIRERAQNAGQGLDRDYRQQSDAARAQDAINAGNTAIANTTAKYNAGLPQQDFENKLKKTAGMAGAVYHTAGNIAANAKDDGDAMRQGFNVAGQAGRAGLDAYNDNRATPGSYSPPPMVQANDGIGDWTSYGPSSQSDWSQYPSSSDALTSAPTRPTAATSQRQTIGFRHDGSPIYQDELR